MKSKPLNQVAEIIMGQSPPGETYNEHGEGMIFFQGVADFGFRYPKDRVYCTKPKKIAKENDILISVRAPIGRINVAKTECAIGRGLGIIRAYDDGDQFFLEFALLSLDKYWESLEGEGTVFGNLSKLTLHELPIPWFEKPERVSIGKNFDDLTSKIQNLQNENKILEQTAQAIFKSWFVDFDGVTEFEDSELGQIPKGWIIQTLDNISKLTMGLSPVGSSYNTENDGVPLLNGPADFSMNSISPKKFTTKPTRICQKDDVLLCVRATIGNAIFSDKEYCLGRGVGSLTPKQFHGEFLYEIINHYTKKLTQESGGSVIIGLTKPDLEKLSFAYSEKIVIEFHKTTNQTIKKIRNNVVELTNIAKIRDALLPKLISGEIRV